MVTRLLGKGAQARVYLGFDARLRQWRAIKVLASNYIDDDHVRQRFEHEAEAMARLNHRNLLRVMDIDNDGGTPFIVMELARGGALTDWLKRNGALCPRMAVDVIVQACRGLEHAHQFGVVHRDVKPHNLLIADDGRVLLTDFGIAQVSEAASMTQTGSVMGTFAYMAPEQRSDAKSVDGRADVYALGATLYTLLTLKTSAELFFAETRSEILTPVPEPLRGVILDACRYDRDERTPTVVALADALEALIPSLPEVSSLPLCDAVLPLPERPEGMLMEDSGVEDLQQALALRDTDAPTYVPHSRLEELLQDQSTTLYSDTGVGNEAGPAHLSADQSARLSIEDLSEEDGPTYADASTLDPPRPPQPQALAETTKRPPRVTRGTPAIRADPVPEAIEPMWVEDGPPQRGRPSTSRGRIEPPRVDTTPPASRRSVWSGVVGILGGASAAGAALVLLVVFGVMGYGLVEKVAARMDRDQAATSLIKRASEQNSVITDLVAAGGDRETLESLWFAIEDASSTEKPRRAADYAEAVTNEADRLQIDAMAATQVAQLRTARRDWMTALEVLEEARTSPLGRLTGDIGAR